ncbi:MAG TPA: electron transfer flavoprotein subunit alpha/FixB family protein, partial [Anaerovoracaceae bacterium]|nr:electron transfer flavoprotein subunit alpha/FixB family protein [Anaerovoracaceae bacterium]
YVKALEFVTEEPAGKPLEEAEVIIAGGFGIGSREQWSLLEKLADILEGAVGCTRPAVDEGLAQEYQMIGTSGKTVRPKVYLGAAISGAAHHICGMKDADFIININKDEKASIFEVSDLGVVGDAGTILKILCDEMS